MQEEEENAVMSIYANSGGNSGVISYETGPDSITVTFHDGATYLYNYAVTGQNNVEQMKALAKAGQGLNAFINITVRKNYAAKLN